jgi:hypothetical protein
MHVNTNIANHFCIYPNTNLNVHVYFELKHLNLDKINPSHRTLYIPFVSNLRITNAIFSCFLIINLFSITAVFSNFYILAYCKDNKNSSGKIVDNYLCLGESQLETNHSSFMLWDQVTSHSVYLEMYVNKVMRKCVDCFS